jgi:hypothetical protein
VRRLAPVRDESSVARMLRRIILTRTTGQLGNRLMVGAHVLAAAVECGAVCLNPTFLDYSDWFEGTRRSLATWTIDGSDEITPQLYHLRMRKAAYLATRAAWQLGKIIAPLSLGRVAQARAPKRQPQDLKDVIEQARGATTLLLQGYYFRHAPWAERHAQLLRSFFLPCTEHRQAAEHVIKKLRQRCAVVVAVHLRHGDYKTHLDGRYFWSVPEYRMFMERMQTLLTPTQVGFLICSNAQHQPDEFTGLTWSFGPGSVPADLHAMACCDYVLGPPSSFSAWAAFQGNTKLLHLNHRDQAFSLADFTVQNTPTPPCEAAG